MDIEKAIAKRRSVRAYLETVVPAGDVEKVVEAGRWAPNAGPFQISVVLNAGLRKKINDRTLQGMQKSDREFLRQRASLPGYQPLYGAPVLILVSAPAGGLYAANNASLAAENMLLRATGLGLSSCHLASPILALNGEANRDLAKESGIPEGYDLQCAVIVGHAAAEDPFTRGERAPKGTVNYVE